MNTTELYEFIAEDLLRLTCDYVNGEVAIWREKQEWQAELFYTPRYSKGINFSVSDVIVDNRRLKEIADIDPKAILVSGSWLVNASDYCPEGLDELLDMNYYESRGDQISLYLKNKENFLINKD